MGDVDVMNDCVSRYKARDIKYFPDRALARSGNADIIPLIAENLNKDEPANRMERRGGDILLNPISVDTAGIIKKIILESPVFSPAVHDWAKALPNNYDDLRNAMRTWWTQNKASLDARQYSQVKPPQ
jgi:hypothetical protein